MVVLLYSGICTSIEILPLYSSVIASLSLLCCTETDQEMLNKKQRYFSNFLIANIACQLVRLRCLILFSTFKQRLHERSFEISLDTARTKGKHMCICLQT